MSFKFNTRMSASDITKGLFVLGKMSEKMHHSVQCLAVSILAAWKEHGDTPTATKRANALLSALGNGVRKNTLKAYFEQLSPMVWNKEEKALVYGFSSLSPVKAFAKIDLAACEALKWHEAGAPEPEYVPLDWTKAIESLIKRAETEIKKRGAEATVTPDMVEKLKALKA